MSKQNFILAKAKQYVKQLLSAEVKLMQATLDNGTVIEAESWEAGEPVFIVGEDGENIPLPEGSYATEDGTQIVVQEEGIIAEVMGSNKEEEMSEDAPNYVTQEQLEAAISSVVEKLSAEKVEQSKEEPKKEEAKVEASKQEPEQKEEAKVEMSADDMPAATPLKANPERDSEKRNLKLYSQKRPQTTGDTVRNKIFNIKKRK